MHMDARHYTNMQIPKVFFLKKNVEFLQNVIVDEKSTVEKC
jgi:hypothetical protein